MTKSIKFTKMHGLGNDFMVIDATKIPFYASKETIKSWSNRHLGVGFDQLLVVELTESIKVDFRYRIFNADGSEVQQCGNGARCFAKFVIDKGLTDKTAITVATASGIIVLYIEDNGLIRVNMGSPSFLPQDLPFNVAKEAKKYDLVMDGEKLEIGAVAIGNPHAVISVANIDLAPINKVGTWLESHKLFPEKVNVGFVEKIDSTNIKLRVYERGAAETLACGTGACAAMVVLRMWGEVEDTVTVGLLGGDLIIRWSGVKTDPVWMSGPATTVFEGEIVCD